MHTTDYTVTLPVYSVVRHHFQNFDTRGATELTIDYPYYPASPGIVAAKWYLLVHFIFLKNYFNFFLWISWHSPDFWWNINPPLNPQKLPLLNPTSKCSPWCLMGPICSTFVHSQIHLHYMCTIDSQSVQPFDHNFPVFWIVDPITPPTMPPCGIVGIIVWAYVHSQMNPQTCTKFRANRSSRLTAFPDFWMCDPLPPPPPDMPLGYWGVTCI